MKQKIRLQNVERSGCAVMDDSNEDIQVFEPVRQYPPLDVCCPSLSSLVELGPSCKLSDLREPGNVTLPLCECPDATAQAGIAHPRQMICNLFPIKIVYKILG